MSCAKPSAPAGALLRRPQEFLQSFRLAARDRGAPSDLLQALSVAVLELPVPPPWREEVGSTVYFWNPSTDTSSWQHPLMEAFLRVLEALQRVIRDCRSASEVAQALTKELKEADDEAAKKLEGWSEAEAPEGARYFYNALTGESSWENPAEAAQHELYAQYWLMGRFVEHFYGDMAHLEGSSFLSALRERVHLPDEVKDYAAWIASSVASASRVVRLPTPQRRTRPPLPPLTALQLKANAAPLQPNTAFLVRAPVDPVEVPKVLQRAESSGQLERRRRTYPSLTNYPLRRSILIWKPVADPELHGSQARRSQTTPL